MAEAVEVKVEHLQVLRLEPDDVLVITTKLPLSAGAVAYMREHLEETFPGHKAIVLDNGAELGVMRRHDADESLSERHQRHYRFCNCLGDKAICCDPTCPCDVIPPESGSTLPQYDGEVDG